MKKTLSSPKVKNVNPPAAVQDPKPAAKFTPRGGSKNRILIAVQDSKIDFAAMGSESAKALNDLMHTPEVQAQFNIGPLRDRFDPQHCKRIYEALGLAFMGFAKMAWKWPNEALEKLAYTEDEKEELSKPTAAVLDEFAPGWLKEHQSLAALALVFSAMTQNKLREAAMIAATVKKFGKAEAQRADGLRVVPMTPAPPSVTTAASGTEPARKPIAVDVNLAPGGGPEIPNA